MTGQKSTISGIDALRSEIAALTVVSDPTLNKWVRRLLEENKFLRSMIVAPSSELGQAEIEAWVSDHGI